jgi:16S rRNA (adenine1518-N6/adenine1519-N6)-dimethyltransferase
MESERITALSMQNLAEIKQLLAARGLRPKHRFGQNFLGDLNLMRKLIEAAHIVPGDLVLEVGPGTGSLTEALLDAGAVVIACELDRDLAAIVRARLGDRITLIEGDAMQRGRTLNPAVVEALGGRSFTLVANLPYQIATSLMTALLIDHPTCIGQFVTVQAEVADRIVSPPGNKDYGPLTIITQAFANVALIAKAPRTCFWPQPKVESAMLAITPTPASEHGIEDPHGFARFVVNLFTKRRKQLGTIFGRNRDDWPPPETGITAVMRPEALSVAQMIILWRAFGSRV